MEARIPQFDFDFQFDLILIFDFLHLVVARVWVIICLTCRCHLFHLEHVIEGGLSRGYVGGSNALSDYREQLGISEMAQILIQILNFNSNLIISLLAGAKVSKDYKKNFPLNIYHK